MGDDSTDEVSGEVRGVAISAGDRDEFEESLPELEDRLLVEG